MNRVIKFRVWDPHKKVYMPHFEPLTVNVLTWDYDHAPNPKWQHGLRDLVFQQFTGLLDSKGCEIYEGDIVEWDGVQYEVIYYAPSGAWVRFPTDWRFDTHTFFSTFYSHDAYGLDACLATDLRVIGNIFENPNFLSRP